MKKLIYIIAVIIGLGACENFDIDHPDFDYTSGFFPYQFPVRTLVLGDYIYDNSNDNAHKFLISVAMGGVYENTEDRVFQIQVDESLCDNIYFTDEGEPVRALPSSYYTLSSESQIVIPAGKYNGNIEVQLTDAFFADPKAIGLSYVVPIVLQSSADVDTILSGQSSNPLADRRVAAEWSVAPKDFTMFAVKYINEYHGTYFRYGTNTVTDSTSSQIESNEYNTENYIVNYPTESLVTTGRYQVGLTMFLNSETFGDEVSMLLTFNGEDCSISAPEGSAFAISGSGSFKPNAAVWGDKDRDVIEINYTVSDGKNTCVGNETLVIRDRAVVMEVYSPVVED